MTSAINLKKVQTLFINSDNVIDEQNINDFYVYLNDSLIKADDDNTDIRVSVIHLCINRSYYTIESNITFILNNVTQNIITNFTIASGYYTVYTFRLYLLTILVSWIITYNESTNTYTFTPPSDGNTYTFTFINSGNLFGFPNTVTNMFENSSPITSSMPILMNLENSLFIRTDIPRRRYGAKDNLSGSTFVESNILCAIPMTFAPFQNITIDVSNQFLYYLSVKEVNKFRLFITDQYSNPIPFRYDYTIALKFEFIETKLQDDTLKTLQEIRDLLKYITLHKFL